MGGVTRRLVDVWHDASDAGGVHVKVSYHVDAGTITSMDHRAAIHTYKPSSLSSCHTTLMEAVVFVSAYLF